MTSVALYGETLHDMAEGLAAVVNGGFVVDEETGEIMFDPSDFEALQASFNDKVEACCAVYENKRAMAEAIKAKEAELAKRRSAYEKSAERLRGYVKDCMEAVGETKVETPMFTASLRKCPPKVEVIDPDAVPDEFCKVERKPKLNEIKKAMVNGDVAVPGCTVITGNTSITIK